MHPIILCIHVNFGTSCDLEHVFSVMNSLWLEEKKNWGKLTKQGFRLSNAITVKQISLLFLRPENIAICCMLE